MKNEKTNQQLLTSLCLKEGKLTVKQYTPALSTKTKES